MPSYVPGHDNFVIDSIELHVLESPSFIQSLRNNLLLETVEIRRVVKPDRNSVAKLLD